MTKPEITSQASKPTQIGTAPKAKATTSPEDKRNPYKPFHVNQEEFWEHIHEIEKGPFIPVEECHQRIQ